MAAAKNPFEDEERTVAMPGDLSSKPKRPLSKVQTPKTSALKPSSAPPVPSSPTGASSAKLAPVVAPPRPRATGRFASSFGEENTQMNLVMGKALPLPKPSSPSLTPAAVQQVATRFDGKKAAPSVEVPVSQLRPMQLEVESEPGLRQALLTRAVIDQFAPETNSRYATGECGHIFIWDFTRAMGCATPRWKGKTELNMVQVCSWFRSLATGDGWIKIAATRASELLHLGHPVVAMPKTAGAALLAVGRPEDVDVDGTPFLSSACSRRRGARLTTREAFGQRHADYYFHP